MLVFEGPIGSSEELRAYVIGRIEAGEWSPGMRLPSVRSLAGDLGLAPNTVAKAYRELEAAGWVHTAGRKGTVVAERFDGDAEARGLELAIDYLQALRGLGFDADDAMRFVHRAVQVADPSERAALDGILDRMEATHGPPNEAAVTDILGRLGD